MSFAPNDGTCRTAVEDTINLRKEKGVESDGV